MQGLNRRVWTPWLLAAVVAASLAWVTPASAQVMPDADSPVVVFVDQPGSPTISELSLDTYGLLETPEPAEFATDEANLAPVPEPVGRGLLAAAMIAIFVATKLRYRWRARSLYGSP